MRWHPDRNSSPEAKERFQEIQRAYQTLQSECAPRNSRALWEEILAPSGADGDNGDNGDNGEKYAQEGGVFWRDNFPFAAAALAGGGALAFMLAEYPGNWVLLSLFFLAADRAYKTGITSAALRAEAAFRLALRLYWLALLAAVVWMLWRRVVFGA